LPHLCASVVLLLLLRGDPQRHAGTGYSKGRKGMHFTNRTAVLALAGLLATSVGRAWAAPQSGGVQASASAQSQAGASAQAGKANGLGTEASGSGSASSSVSASGSAADKSVALSDGTTMNATLTHSLDVKKNKPGDPVEARTTRDVKQNGKVVIPRGTRLVGHVTQAQARGGGQSESTLGVAFDRAELRDGRQVPLNNATIQAVAASQSAAQATTGDSDVMATGGATTAVSASGGAIGGLTNAAGRTAGGAVGGASSNVGAISSTAGHTAGTAAGSTVNATGRSAGAVGGLDTQGMLAANSRGAFGLDSMSLNSAASGAAEGSAIVSGTRNVHLDGGTQMLLRAQGQAR
jgi:hypothetical protein